MTAKPVEATIFAYQVGFGDCFLVRFIYKRAGPRHILIDFGSTGLPKNIAVGQMLRIANDIRDKCLEGSGKGLDVVVATHRHMDHISGFATSDGNGPGDVIAGLRPKVVIQPWTEAPQAPVDWLGPEGTPAPNAFAARRASLEAMHESAGLALKFLTERAHDVPHAVAKELRFIGEDNLANLSAVKNLQSMGQRNLYVFHGCKLDLSAELPGVDIKVLGPPTLHQTESIRKQRSRDADEFWQLAPRRLDVPPKPLRKSNLFPNAKTFPASKLLTEHRWLAHRMDQCNAELMLSLVRALDNQMNNTSTILLFDAGKKRLLFPGDAQLENWQYALQAEYADLLDDVDLYKVGHHGSLNATPKSLWKRFRKRGPEGDAGRLTSVLSTMKGKHGSEDNNTEVPRRPLLTELDANSELISTQTLPDDQLYREVRVDLR